MYERCGTAHPELYPDLVAAGSLGSALVRESALLDRRLGTLEPVDGFDAAVTACCARGKARFKVFATNQEEREFRFEISTDNGWPWGAFGSTPDLAVVAAILHAWCGGASVSSLMADWPFLASLPLDAAPAGRVVSTAWRLTLERNPVIRLGDPEIAEALHSHPELRVFFPFPSHGEFSLLSSTAVEFHEVVPRVAPAGAGSWRVVTPSSSGVERELGTGLSAYEAAALVAANVPEDAGPAIEGGWPPPTQGAPR
ncbi:DUF6193 family natural product biosynthesis protein [Kitasatospora sp. NPDC088134]|uniref:DUF6193 family natural product biosynthesis protein n=1 Tax=Kitasatospora sp. NPDC088134 TaxID=3364071 RepID=UPI0038224B2E